MTTHKPRRCCHCSTPYRFQASGWGGGQYNDDRYCPECMEVVTKALKNVKVKFAKRWEPTTDYTMGQIVEAQDKRIPPGSCGLRRILPGLTHMKDGEPSEVQNVVCEKMRDPISGQDLYYLARWWGSGRYPIEVSKEVWWDIKAGKAAENQWDWS